MQAIKIRFLGPTNNRGCRYKASCDAGNVTISQDYALLDEENSKAALAALLKKLPDWPPLERWVSGSLEKGDVTVFVATEART